MSRKRSTTAVATQLRKRFHERVQNFYAEPPIDQKPSLTKWLLFMLLFLLIGFLFFYVLGTQSLFQFPVNNNADTPN